jgi:hypothetical protein
VCESVRELDQRRIELVTIPYQIDQLALRKKRQSVYPN